MTPLIVTELEPALIVPVKVPLTVPVPVPVFSVRLTPVFALTLAAWPFASWDWTTTGKATAAVGFAPPLMVIASFVVGSTVNVAEAVSAGEALSVAKTV